MVKPVKPPLPIPHTRDIRPGPDGTFYEVVSLADERAAVLRRSLGPVDPGEGWVVGEPPAGRCAAVSVGFTPRPTDLGHGEPGHVFHDFVEQPSWVNVPADERALTFNDLSARTGTDAGLDHATLRVLDYLRAHPATDRRRIGMFWPSGFTTCEWCGGSTRCHVVEWHESATAKGEAIHTWCHGEREMRLRHAAPGWSGRGGGGTAEHVKREARRAREFHPDDRFPFAPYRPLPGWDLVGADTTLGEWRTARRLRSAQQRARDSGRARRFTETFTQKNLRRLVGRIIHDASGPVPVLWTPMETFHTKCRSCER